MKVQEQRCDRCGRLLGTFIHSRQLDGPLICERFDCQPEVEAGDEDAFLDNFVDWGAPYGIHTAPPPPATPKNGRHN